MSGFHRYVWGLVFTFLFLVEAAAFAQQSTVRAAYPAPGQPEILTVQDETPANWPGSTFADDPGNQWIWRVPVSPYGLNTRRVMIHLLGQFDVIMPVQNPCVENLGTMPLTNVVASWSYAFHWKTRGTRRNPPRYLTTTYGSFAYNPVDLDSTDGNFDCGGPSGHTWVPSPMLYNGSSPFDQYLTFTFAQNPEIVRAFSVSYPGDAGYAHFMMVPTTSAPSVQEAWSATGPQGQYFDQNNYGHFRMPIAVGVHGTFTNYNPPYLPYFMIQFSDN